jgi:hypothetical protein
MVALVILVIGLLAAICVASDAAGRSQRASAVTSSVSGACDG